MKVNQVRSKGNLSQYKVLGRNVAQLKVMEKSCKINQVNRTIKEDRIGIKIDKEINLQRKRKGMKNKKTNNK